MKPNDIYTRITEQIIELMEKHGSDWTRPWSGTCAGMHRNIITDANYRGINVLLLGLTAHKNGYDSPVWGTYRQWQAKGGRVRKAEKGTLGVFYKPLTVSKDNEERSISVLKHFHLFNLAQVDGVEIEAPDPAPEPERIDAAESFISNTGAVVHQGGSRAAYIPSKDYIRIPLISSFVEREAYYSTLLHELSHWTGHWTRLDRKSGMVSRFGDESYAMEELVAEIGSAFLSISLNITHEPGEDNAKYLNNWLSVLKGDMRAFTTAASKAQQVTDYLQDLQERTEAAA